MFIKVCMYVHKNLYLKSKKNIWFVLGEIVIYSVTSILLQRDSESHLNIT